MDKLHLPLSAVLAIGLSYLFQHIPAGVSIAFLIGLGWEFFWNKYKGNPISGKDILHDFEGCAIGLGVVLILQYFGLYIGY